MPYQCFAEDGHEAVLLVTNLAEGDTLGVCADDLAAWAQTFLTSITGHEWAPVASSGPDPETGDETDEDDRTDGPVAPVAPTPEQVPPAEEPGDDDDDDDLAEDDQRAEDEAVFQAGLREELAGRPRF